MVLEQKVEFSVSLLKDFMKTHEVKVGDEEEEIIGDETDILRVTKVIDEGKDKVKSILFRSTSFTLTVTKSRRKLLKKTWRLRSHLA